MAKLIIIPKFNQNFWKSIKLGITLSVFIFCSGSLAVRYFGANVTVVVFLLSLFCLFVFSYLVYITLEIQDRLPDDRGGPNRQ